MADFVETTRWVFEMRTYRVCRNNYRSKHYFTLFQSNTTYTLKAYYRHIIGWKPRLTYYYNEDQPKIRIPHLTRKKEWFTYCIRMCVYNIYDAS